MRATPQHPAGARQRAALARRAESAADFLAALVVGLLAVAALLHWATPCALPQALCATTAGEPHHG